LTQNDLAKLLNVHQTAISQWEQERTMPNIETAKKMVTFFGVTLDYLLGNEEEIETTATHSDSDEWTDEEVADIEKFKEFIRMKKNK
jgi:transcriptional regulator with XRE-family HTH domain